MAAIPSTRPQAGSTKVASSVKKSASAFQSFSPASICRRVPGTDGRCRGLPALARCGSARRPLESVAAPILPVTMPPLGRRSLRRWSGAHATRTTDRPKAAAEPRRRAGRPGRSSLAVVAVVLSLTNDGEPEETTRRNEAALLLAALNQTESLTVGFSATYTLTQVGESTTTKITGARPLRRSRRRRSHQRRSIPERGSPIDVTLVRTEGKRYLSLDDYDLQGGAGSVLSGRHRIAAGRAANDHRARHARQRAGAARRRRRPVPRGGGHRHQRRAGRSTDHDDHVPEIQLDADGLPVGPRSTPIGGNPDDVQVEVTLNMVFAPSLGAFEPITLPATASDGPGSALRYPVIAEALRIRVRLPAAGRARAPALHHVGGSLPHQPAQRSRHGRLT